MGGTEKGTHGAALDARFPLSSHARARVGYTEKASPCVPHVPLREFVPVWLRGGNRPNPNFPLPKKEAVVAIDGRFDLALDMQSTGLANYGKAITHTFSALDDCQRIRPTALAVWGNRRVTIGSKSGGARP